ncbi:MAG: hypothetical protein ACREPM_19210 [Gemmatimonadaceae bacterium]
MTRFVRRRSYIALGDYEAPALIGQFHEASLYEARRVPRRPVNGLAKP